MSTKEGGVIGHAEEEKNQDSYLLDSHEGMPDWLHLSLLTYEFTAKCETKVKVLFTEELDAIIGLRMRMYGGLSGSSAVATVAKKSGKSLDIRILKMGFTLDRNTEYNVQSQDVAAFRAAMNGLDLNTLGADYTQITQDTSTALTKTALTALEKRVRTAQNAAGTAGQRLDGQSDKAEGAVQRMNAVKTDIRATRAALEGTVTEAAASYDERSASLRETTGVDTSISAVSAAPGQHILG